MPWYAYAFLAAFTWGIHYTLLGRALTVISPFTAYWMPTIIMIIGLPIFHKILVGDFIKFLLTDAGSKISIVLTMFTGLIGTLALFKAIQSHNPVHAGLLEISYPIFVALFTLLIFRENHFSMSTIIGGLFIMAGAMIIIANN